MDRMAVYVEASRLYSRALAEEWPERLVERLGRRLDWAWERLLSEGGESGE